MNSIIVEVVRDRVKSFCCVAKVRNHVRQARSLRR